MSVLDDITKIERDEVVTYLDVTPNSDPTFEILGIGITDYGISYNPQVDTEKWIIERNARSDHKSNQKQGSVSQTAYKGDPVFEFVADGRDALNYKTHILDIDAWADCDVLGAFKATLSDGKVVVTNYMGENATIEYDLYYDGDLTYGTVTFDTNNKPVFTPDSPATNPQNL